MNTQVLVTLVKQTDAPDFTSPATGARAGLGWVCGYPAKALAEIKDGPDAGMLAVIVHRPGFTDAFQVIISAATYTERVFSYESGARAIDAYPAWDTAMALILGLTR